MLANDYEQPKFLSLVKKATGTLYQYYSREGEQLISFRSLHLPQDLELLYTWVHSEKARRFWCLDIPKSKLETLYASILNSPHTHSFLGFKDHTAVCQVDVYTAAFDEIAPFIEDLQPSDTGLHFLMAPAPHPIPHLSQKMFYHFLRYYFSFSSSLRIWGEPDAQNDKAIRLIQSCGFRPVKTVSLSYKTALLHCLTKEAFQPLK